MTAGAILTIVGGCLQLVGLGIAGLGVRNVRVSRAPRRLGTWGVMKAFGLRHLVRRRSPVTADAFTTVVSSADAGAIAEGARVQTGLSPDATPEQREQFMLGELRWLREAVGDLREDVAAEGQTRDATVSRVDEMVREETTARRMEINQAFAEGLVQQTAGLWFAAFGAVLAIIGAGIN